LPTYLRQKWIDLRQDKMINGTFNTIMSSNHQLKCFVLADSTVALMLQCLSVCRRLWHMYCG